VGLLSGSETSPGSSGTSVTGGVGGEGRRGEISHSQYLQMCKTEDLRL